MGARYQEMVANARVRGYDVEGESLPSLAESDWEYVLGIPSGEFWACEACGARHEGPGRPGRRGCFACGGPIILVREWREVSGG